MTTTPQDSPLIARQESVTVQDIIDIFAGGHLATAVEAMGFTEAIGLDTDVMYGIICQAAGSNRQFVDHVPKMKKPTWTLRDVPEAKDVCRRLVRLPIYGICLFVYEALEANRKIGIGGKERKLYRRLLANSSCIPTAHQVTSPIDGRLHKPSPPGVQDHTTLNICDQILSFSVSL